MAVYKDIFELKNTQKKLEIMNEKLRVIGGMTRHDVRNKLSTTTRALPLYDSKRPKVSYSAMAKKGESGRYAEEKTQ